MNSDTPTLLRNYWEDRRIEVYLHRGKRHAGKANVIFHKRTWITPTLEENQHRHVWGNVLISGHVDYLSTLVSTVPPKKKKNPALNHKLWDTDQRKTNSLSRDVLPRSSLRGPLVSDPDALAEAVGPEYRAVTFLMCHQLGLHGGCPSDTVTSHRQVPASTNTRCPFPTFAW